MATANSSTELKKAKPRGKPFVKGQSGNPSGRPKAIQEILEIARKDAPLAIARLVGIIKDSPDERAVVAACKELLDRALGKAPQTITGDGDAPLVVQLIEVLRSSDPD
jgi:hypothetical protein